jgi:hypothetical protein
MKIFICESYHDNDCGVFIDLATAVRHFHGEECSGEDLVEYDTDTITEDGRLPGDQVIHDCGWKDCRNIFYRDDAKALKTSERTI